MKCTAVFFGVLILAMGCSSTSPEVKEALLKSPEREAVTCETDDCSEFWERAKSWVVAHSKCDILWSLDCVVLTVEPSGQNPVYSFAAKMEGTDDGRYEIVLEMYCGNAFGCDPKPEDVRRAFYYYVETGVDLLEDVDHLGRGIK